MIIFALLFQILLVENLPLESTKPGITSEFTKIGNVKRFYVNEYGIAFIGAKSAFIIDRRKQILYSEINPKGKPGMQAPKEKEFSKMTPGYTWSSFLDEDRFIVSNELNLEMNGIFEISTQSWRQSRGWESRSFHSLHTDDRVAVGRKKFSWYTLLIVDKKTNQAEEMTIDYNAYMQAFETVRWEVDHLPQSSFQCLDYPYFAEFDVNAPVVVLYQLEQKKQKAIVLEMEPMFGGQGQRYQILPGAIQADKERIFITTIALNDGEVSLFNRNTLLVFDFKGQLVQKIESKFKLGLSTTYKGEVYFYGIDPVEYGPIKLLKFDN